jgi:hypothetical protein
MKNIFKGYALDTIGLIIGSFFIMLAMDILTIYDMTVSKQFPFFASLAMFLGMTISFPCLMFTLYRIAKEEKEYHESNKDGE